MEWKRVRLGDYISIKSGLAYKGSKIGKGNSILLGMGCVSFKDKFVESGARSYEEDDCDERFLVKPGDIVLATRQQSNNLPILAMPAIVPNSFEGKRVIFGTNLYKVENHSEISSKFLFWLMKHQHYVNYIASVKSGTAVQMVTKKNVEDYKFMCPPIEVRNRISEILWTYDSLIENNTKRIRLLEKMAENLYKEWFVRFRFPGYEKAEMENGLPKGWKVERVFDIADVMYGYAFKSNHFCDNPALNPVVRIRDIQNNHTNTFTDEECEEKYLIKRNAILIGMDGLFHMCLWNGERAFLNQRVVMLNSKKVDFCNYLLFMAIHPQIKYWEQVISGTTVAHLGDKHLKRVQVIVPSTEILSKANSLIARIMGKKNILLRQNTLLARRRDLLLPRLMSGKLEVKP